MYKLSSQIKHQIKESGRSRYQICKDIGIRQSSLSRFMAGQHNLSLSTLDKIGALLGLRIEARQSKGGKAKDNALAGIDLYAGIGGWALGLKLAGIEIIRSYEWWSSAVETHQKNLSSQVISGDIRRLPLTEYPKGVDVVVGSPPCTQFSFANRGGKGNIEEGLKDIYRFLEVVEYLEPRFWIMENIPRVAQILNTLLQPGERLNKFAHLFGPEPNVQIVDMSEFGLPQRRKRMIAGNFPNSLLLDYRNYCQRKTLGAVVRELSNPQIKDPNYKLTVSSRELTEQGLEEPLNLEELRLNREAKQYHPVYNVMEFPDPLDREARTVTATCTRVSRESIVIESPRAKGRFRRLTIRERATLQGFPITYQFFGHSYSEKIKMIGNALPPVLAYYIGQAINGTCPEKLVVLEKLPFRIAKSSARPIDTEPHKAGRTYPANRSFRFAVPNLRFGSGVRFDLFNSFEHQKPRWRVEFYYGTSKSIGKVILNQSLLGKVEVEIATLRGLSDVRRHLGAIDSVISKNAIADLQLVWAQKRQGIHPFEILDAIGRAFLKIMEDIKGIDECRIERLVVEEMGKDRTMGWVDSPSGKKKIRKYAIDIFVGFLIGSYVNEQIGSAESSG